ncbi:hypothetical protein NSZ01_18740 [Nocardioides szechwanensis]|uniref:Carboxypeptidase regulatory-like domain-containing protein n=1 Tax=Nocardioides szechwanensis TaxID=1005944 RepID=A0A1H0GY81_9ACTN|nr:carboxypeptidase-like regulatory domain-containing protein [Nocardioides szechwanensis]GEP34106.1 hypothetical protein NSZ01_18740 [Nocardioides szechwanensis]SDO11818.1 hypothetical protein SAMN05192576_3386 [Nocardioides szechwanensis]
MPRALALLVTACLALLTLAVVAGPPAAVAADPITGRLVDATGSHPAVQGATVRLRTVTGSGPGTVVDTDVTDSDGKFSLDAGATPDDEYYVQVLAGTYQGVYVGGGYVQPTPAYAVTYGPHATIGKILANPAFIRGVLVNSETGNPVRDVRVTARSANDLSQIEGSDFTGRGGVFRINGLECEDDCYLKVNGAPKGYEVGFRACNAGVVPTWGAACASPIGRIGKVFLDKD